MKVEELQYLNRMIGFFQPTPHWPCPFRHLGLDVHALQNIITVDVDGRLREAKPEAVLASPTYPCALVIEIKSRQLDAMQLRKYAALTTKQIDTLIAIERPDNSCHDVLFIIAPENEEIICRRMETHFRTYSLQWNQAGTFPIVSMGEKEIRLSTGRCTDTFMHQVFAQGIEIGDRDSEPMDFVIFDEQSPISSLIPTIINRVNGYVVNDVAFQTRELCERTIEYWAVRGPQARRAIVNKVNKILWRAVREDYKPFLLQDTAPLEPSEIAWKPRDRQLNNRRIVALLDAMRSFRDKYDEADDAEFEIDQMPLTRYRGSQTRR